VGYFKEEHKDSVIPVNWISSVTTNGIPEYMYSYEQAAVKEVQIFMSESENEENFGRRKRLKLSKPQFDASPDNVSDISDFCEDVTLSIYKKPPHTNNKNKSAEVYRSNTAESISHFTNNYDQEAYTIQSNLNKNENIIHNVQDLSQRTQQFIGQNVDSSVHNDQEFDHSTSMFLNRLDRRLDLLLEYMIHPPST